MDKEQIIQANSKYTDPNHPVNRRFTDKNFKEAERFSSVTKYMRAGIAAMILAIVASRGCKSEGADSQVQDARDAYPTHVTDTTELNNFGPKNPEGKRYHRQWIHWETRRNLRTFLEWSTGNTDDECFIRKGNGAIIFTYDVDRWNKPKIIRTNNLEETDTDYDPVEGFPSRNWPLRKRVQQPDQSLKINRGIIDYYDMDSFDMEYWMKFPNVPRSEKRSQQIV